MVQCRIPPPHENLCGFCGEVCGSNNEISRKTGQMISSCTHYKSYSNGAASKSSGRSPCTNRLISCPTCMDLTWTYTISNHFNNRHPDSDKKIFESFTPSRKEIIAVHNWGVKTSNLPNIDFVPTKKQALTIRQNRKNP